MAPEDRFSPQSRPPPPGLYGKVHKEEEEEGTESIAYLRFFLWKKGSSGEGGGSGQINKHK